MKRLEIVLSALSAISGLPGAFVFVISSLFLVSPAARALSIQERTLPVFGRGQVKFTCLQIDGGVVPLRPPPDTEVVRNEDSLSIVWPRQKGVATIQTASPRESALIDDTGSPDKKEHWLREIWRQIDPTAVERNEIDFQPNVIAVNHWKISGISVDYIIGGVKTSQLLLVWRCDDGKTLAVKLSAAPTDFKEIRQQICEMIGSSLVLR